MFSGKPIKTLDDLPKNSRWLMSADLEKKYKALPNNIRRHLSSSAFIGTKLYDLKADNKWSTFMTKDVHLYDKNRNKGQRSDYENANIPANGMKDIKRALKLYRAQIRNIFTKKPTLARLYKWQMYLALRLMSSNTPVRNNLPTLNVKEQSDNYIKRQNKSTFTIHLGKFKNSKKLGPREIKLNRANNIELNKFLRFRSGLVTHDKLFSLRSGKPMSKSAFSQGLIKLTNRLLDKKIGSRLLRVMFASSKENQEILKKAEEISDKMLHQKGGKQTRQYVKE
jgi:hypothetical protein